MDLRAARPKVFLGDKKKIHTKTLSAVYLFRKEERIPKELRNIKYFFLFQFWVLGSHNNALPWSASWRWCEYGEKMGQKDRLHLWCTVRVFIPGTRFAVEEAVAPPVPAHTQCGSNKDGGFSSRNLSEMPKCGVLWWTTEMLNWDYLDSRALATRWGSDPPRQRVWSAV